MEAFLSRKGKKKQRTMRSKYSRGAVGEEKKGIISSMSTPSSKRKKKGGGNSNTGGTGEEGRNLSWSKGKVEKRGAWCLEKNVFRLFVLRRGKKKKMTESPLTTEREEGKEKEESTPHLAERGQAGGSFAKGREENYESF